MIRCAVLATFLTVAACSKVQQQQQDDPPHLARIEITPSAALFTGVGQSHAFTAQGFDQNDLPVAAAFTWSSSNPAAVSVDGAGGAQSLVAVGSSQLSATSAGVTSSAATVVVAQPAAGAVLIQDAQVVSGPDPLDPDHGLELGAISTLTVHGVNGLAPGVILLAAESAAVAGRVVSVADAGGGNLTVMLQQVSIGELLQHYSIDLQFALKDEGLAPPAQTLRELTADPVPLADWGPLQCTLGGSLSLAGATFTHTLTHDFTGTGHLDEKGAMVKLTGTLDATFKGTVQLAGTLTGTASCKLEVAREIVKLGGPLAAVFALQVPSGVKAELSLTVKTAPGVQFGFEGKATSNVTAGFTCTIDGLCANLSGADTTPELKPIFTVDGVKSFRIEGSLGLYGYVGLDVGSPLAQRLHLVKPLGILEAKLGAKQDFSFGSKDDQATDETYASKYELKIAGSIGLTSTAQAALKKLNIDIVNLTPSLGFDKSLDKSPDGTDKTDKTSAKVGEAVALTVNLAAEHLNYVGIGYNVSSIQFYRRRAGKDLDAAPLGTVAGAGGQSVFTYTWTPTEADSGTNQIYAFVITSPTTIPLEVAVNTKLTVTVAGAGQVTIAVKGSRSQDFAYTGGSGSEASDIDLTFDLELQDKPVFNGGSFGVPYTAFYILTPQISGTVSHDGQKNATGPCDVCVPGAGTFTDDNTYDATGNASAGPAPAAKTTLILDIPIGSANGALNGQLPIVQLSGTGQGSVSISGCDNAPVNRQLTELPLLGPLSLPGNGINITGVDPTAPARLSGTLTYAGSMLVGYPSSQTGASASWDVPVTVTVTYDLPYAPLVIPFRFSGGSNAGAAPTVQAPVVTAPAAPLYLGRRPMRSGHSEPALIARGEPAAGPTPDCLR
jgi:hypothetical protein